MKDPYFAIRLIRRHGEVGAVVVAILAAAGAGCLLWSTIGWPAVPVAVVLGGLVFIIARSYIELVSMVFEKLN